MSLIATRMKTIQGMLAQYFIMRDNNIQIEFISSTNKLSFLKENQPKISGYRERKKQSVTFCRSLLTDSKDVEIFTKSKK